MSMFNATTKEGRARIRSDLHQRTWPLGGSPFTNGQGIERLLDACKALEKEIADRDKRMTAPVTDEEVRAWCVDFLGEGPGMAGRKAALTAFLERRMKG